MTPDTEALRAQFEAWFSGGFPIAVERTADGEYKYMPAHSAWKAYQAGHAAAKAETADVGEPDAREMFNAGWCAAARFCGREDVVYDGLVGPGGCPAFEYAYRAALAGAAQPVPAAEVGGPLNELEELNLLNEPAFPIRGGLHEHQFVGASLRDYFAAKAMQGFVSSYPNGDVNCDFEYLADDAYDMADAMLKARAKGGVE